jgi:AraC-like DNA-binding protein
MSNTRQLADDAAVRAYNATHASGSVIQRHAHPWDQLLYASSGVMTVHTSAGSWVVPSHRSVWVPAEMEHSIVMSGRVAMRTLYFAVGLANLARECRAVDVPPLLRELILRAVAKSPLLHGVPEHQRLIGLLLDELVALPTAPLELAMPRDPRALRVATALVADPANARSLHGLAADAGSSLRTIERLFQVETALTLDQWRRRLRVVEALRLLAAGEQVTNVAMAVGYSTPSAFAAMFRQETGVTPGRYFAR